MGMQVRCKVCGKSIQAEDLNLDNTLAKCRSCNAVFDFSSQIEGKHTQSSPRPGRPRIALPPGIQLRNYGSELLLTRRWMSPQLLFLEQELERALGITDRTVPGELGR